MSEKVKLLASIRNDIGSRESGRLRRGGWIPAVLYGNDMEGTLPLAINEQELRRLLPGGQRGIIDLEVQQGSNRETYPVMVKEIQRDRVKGHIIHLDLYRVSLTRKVTTTVPVHLIGTAPGIKAGGVMQQQLWEVEIECLPGLIPDYLEADVSQLEIGNVLTVEELLVPDQVEVVTPATEAVVSVLAPTVVEEEEIGDEGEELGEEPGQEEGGTLDEGED